MDLLKKMLKKRAVKLSKEEKIKKVTEAKFCVNYMVSQSVAISILALLLFIGAPSVFPEIINPYLPSSLKIMQAIVIVPSVFWILTIISNLFNWYRIKRLF